MGRGNNVVLKLLWIWAMRSEIIKRIKDIEHVNLRTKIFIYFRKLIPVYHLIFITIQIDMKLWWFFLLPLLFCSNCLWVYPCISVQSEYKKNFLKWLFWKCYSSQAPIYCLNHMFVEKMENVVMDTSGILHLIYVYVCKI